MTSQLYSLYVEETGETEIDTLTFEPVSVGSSSSETFYIQNDTDDPLTVSSVSVTSDEGSGSLHVTDHPDTIPAADRGEVRVRADAVRADTLMGITGRIEVQAQGVIRP